MKSEGSPKFKYVENPKSEVERNNNYGVKLCEQGQYREGIEYLNKAINSVCGIPYYNRCLANLLYTAGDRELAYKDYGNALFYGISDVALSDLLAKKCPDKF